MTQAAPHGPPPTAVARGRDAEGRACAYLMAQGYRVLARNHRCAGGEVDIVAWDGGTLCFVEVRARRSAARGHPLETVDRAKQRRIARAAADFATGLPGAWPPMRFDVLAMLLGEPPEIWLVRDAFALGQLGG